VGHTRPDARPAHGAARAVVDEHGRSTGHVVHLLDADHLRRVVLREALEDAAAVVVTPVVAARGEVGQVALCLLHQTLVVLLDLVVSQLFNSTVSKS